MALVMQYHIETFTPNSSMDKFLKIANIFLGEKKLLPTSFKTCKNHIPPVGGKLLTILCLFCNSAIGHFRKKSEITGKKTCCKSEQYFIDNFYEGRYVVNIDFTCQINWLLESFHEYLIKPRNDGLICDIVDGSHYRHYPPNSITFTMLVDSAPVSESSQKSVTPILLFINELPKKLRFKNPILCSVYVGKKSNVSSSSLVDSTIKTLKKLESGIQYVINGKTHFKNCYLLSVVADALERASLRNVKQFNSYYGCDWCLIKTRFNKKNIYPLNETEFTLRTKTDMRMIAISIQKKETLRALVSKNLALFTILDLTLLVVLQLKVYIACA